MVARSQANPGPTHCQILEWNTCRPAIEEYLTVKLYSVPCAKLFQYTTTSEMLKWLPIRHSSVNRPCISNNNLNKDEQQLSHRLYLTGTKDNNSQKRLCPILKQRQILQEQGRSTKSLIVRQKQSEFRKSRFLHHKRIKKIGVKFRYLAFMF